MIYLYISLTIVCLLISIVCFLVVYMYNKTIKQKEYTREYYFRDEFDSKYNTSHLLSKDVMFSEQLVKTKSNLDLKLQIYKNKDTKSKKIVLFHHGMKTTHFAAFKHFAWLLKEDYICITYDSRGWGLQNINNLKCSYGYFEKDDLNDVVQYIKNTYDVDSLILMGESMGGLTCLEYLKKYGTDSIDKLVLDGSVTDLELTITNNAKKQAPWLPKFIIRLFFVYTKLLDKWDPLTIKPYKWLRNESNLDILMIHTRVDKTVDYKNMLLVKDYIKDNKNFTFSTYVKAKHVYELGEDKRRYVSEFLNFANK